MDVSGLISTPCIYTIWVTSPNLFCTYLVHKFILGVASNRKSITEFETSFVYFLPMTCVTVFCVLKRYTTSNNGYFTGKKR